MKKLIFALCVCAGLCACSSDDDLVGSTSTGNSAEGVAFLRVNLKDVGSSTRATSDGFTAGTGDEQAVKNAYFYLYKEDGSYYAYGSVGEVSGTATTPSTDNGEIEWESTTQVAIYGLTDPDIPKMMLTVINQPSGFSLQNKKFDDAVATLAGTPWGDTSNGFVMSTSVCGSSNYTALTAENFALEPIYVEEDYADGGVNVYVERLAAKVSVSDGITVAEGRISDATNHIYTLTAEEQENFPMGLPTSSAASNVGGIGIQLLGFDVDAIARDAYVSKHIDTTWSLSFTWNAETNHRSYWAESPNYGVETTYPTSAYNATTQKYNTADDEDNSSTWLNEYLRYVDLNSAVALSTTDTPTYVYCGENTNTVGNQGVIDAADNNGLTNVLVKAQFGDYNPNAETNFTPIDLVEFHKEYYTADQFLQKCVDDVVDYDFTVLVDEVIAALEDRYGIFAGYIEDLKAAINPDHVYKSTPAVNDHQITSENLPTSVTAFGGEMLSLYNIGDGNVDIFYNMSTQPQWGTVGSFTNIDNALWEKYPSTDRVYNTEVDLDAYDFWFHVNYADLTPTEITGLTTLGLLYQIGETEDDWYMPIDNSISFTTQSSFDNNFTGSHTYTMRNFLLRAITVEADGIDTEFGSIYPNYYKNGLMYYHVPIEHLGVPTDDTLVEGEYGVVRNHWYDVTITSLNGIGRGIADEDEVIVPQKEIPYYYLGADINILSWNHVPQSVAW